MLHALRFSRPTPQPDTLEFNEAFFQQPVLFDYAASFLEHDSAPQVRSTQALPLAELAQDIARHIGGCSPAAAYAVGLLAGQYLGDEVSARKLFPRWQLPTWMSVAVGFPKLSIDDAVRLGGNRDVLNVLAEARAEFVPHSDSTVQLPTKPHDTVLMVRLLRLAGKARSRSAASVVMELERRVEELSNSLEEHQNRFDEKLHEAKLSSMAEFAAGASHEINNPLAVIATNVQLLMSHEDDEERLNHYEAVLRQTKRIHELLNGTRQFARPPHAIPALLSVSSWVNAVARDCEPEATERNVSLQLPRTAHVGRLWADAGQVRTIVNHLVKNAIAAAGDDGWVRVKIETHGAISRIIVEDSGEAPTHRTMQHLFDPFYSGREAGRGRGLGLPIAWQLARQNGGSLQYERADDGPTRFVLTLPAVPTESALPTRQSA